jgi:hypothetical protein
MSILEKTRVLVLVLVFLAASCIIGAKPASGVPVAEDSWATVTTLPTNATMGYYPAFGHIGVAAVNGKIYCFGVITQNTIVSYVSYNVSERYDIESNTWTATSPPIINGAIVACENKIYSIGGGSDVPTQVYDPSTDMWENRTAAPKDFHGAMPNVVGDKIYLISGLASYGNGGVISASDASYVYDTASDSWSTIAPITTSVVGYASAVLDSKIYIISGGTSTPSLQNATNLVQIFDPKSNQWNVGKELPYGVYGGAACSTEGVSAPKRIYVVGGNTFYGGWTSADLTPHGTTYNQVYDPATDSWSMGASLLEPRWFCSLINVNDSLFAVGGLNGPADSGMSQYHSPEKVVLSIDKYIPVGCEANSPPTPYPSLTPNIPELSWLIVVPLLFSVFSIFVIIRHRKTAK